MTRIVRGVLLPAAAFVVTCLASWLLFPVYLFAPFTLLLALIVLMCLYGAPLSAAAAVLGTALGLAAHFGPLGAVVALLMYAPGAAAAVITLRKGYRLLDAACVTAAAAVAGAVCAWALVTLLAGDIASLLTGVVEKAYLDIDEQTQRTLYPMLNAMLGGSAGDAPELMRDRVVELVFYVDEALRMALPARILEYGAVSGLLAVVLPRCVLLRAGRDDGMARFTPIHKWRVPRNVQTGVTVLFLVTLLGGLVGLAGMEPAFHAVWALLNAVYAVMGCALADRLMLRRGVKPGARMLLMLVFYTFLRTPLFVLGMAEVFVQSRSRRKAEHEGGM